jgi:hypothetical protein
MDVSQGQSSFHGHSDPPTPTSFLREQRGFEHREDVICDQRQKMNQNMHRKVENKFHSNFALAEPYNETNVGEAKSFCEKK